MYYLLTGTNYPKNFCHPISFQNIVQRISTSLEHSHCTRHELEERIGWDLTAFLEHPQYGFELPIFFFRDICQSLDLDWKSVTYYYEPKT